MNIFGISDWGLGVGDLLGDWEILKIVTERQGD